LTNEPTAEARPSHSPSVAAFLSFLWPGLGQAYERRRRAAVLFAVPALIAAGLLLVQAARGLDVLAIELITPTFALTVLIIVLLLGAWRLIAMADAAMASGPPRAWRRRPTIIVLVALSVVVLATHAAAAYYAYSFYDAGNAIFVGQVTPTPTPAPDGSGSPGPSASGSAIPSDNSVDFVGTPEVTPPTQSSRINILFTGIDSGHGRDHALTDTMLIASVDPDTKQVVMVSFPRDISNFKLWDGRTFKGKLNSLMTYARLHPDQYPDGAVGTLTKELGYLLGVPIYYYAAINLDGFKQMVDLVGGVTITYPHDIIDPSYAWEDAAGSHGFVFRAGTHHLDGRTALAFVRSRKADSDFARAARQQILLIALRKELTRPSMLPKIPALLKAAAQTVRTDFPASQAADMVALLRGINDTSIQRYVLGPPYSTHPNNATTGGIYTLKLNMTKVANLSVRLFGTDSRYYQAPTASPAGSQAP
jgi:polyisoprenyl-teichoic acid--peptidoglycan teichoic acid transferase